MAPGTAKLLEAPNAQGWYVIKLDKTIPGNARAQPRVTMAARREIGRGLGREYVQELTNAIRKAVGVKRNDAAIADVRKALTSDGGSDQ
jgi:peptidyl-prolyl cis-trans isomerase D